MRIALPARGELAGTGPVVADAACRLLTALEAPACFLFRQELLFVNASFEERVMGPGLIWRQGYRIAPSPRLAVNRRRLRVDLLWDGRCVRQMEVYLHPLGFGDVGAVAVVIEPATLAGEGLVLPRPEPCVAPIPQILNPAHAEVQAARSSAHGLPVALAPGRPSR